MFLVYIIYSEKADRFYIGQTEDLERRIQWHNSHEFKYASTVIANDWTLFYSIKCNNRTQALAIEKHIKRMRNRTFYNNLKQFPEITQRLLEKYK